MIRLKKVLGFLLAVSLLGGSPNGYAIGDSGGCADPLSGRLGKALKSGTEEDLEIELKKRLDHKEKNLSKIKKFSVGDITQWRSQEVKNMIEGRHDKYVTCGPGPLLPVAAQAGNLEVVRYLLGTPMGSKPAVPADILFSCKDSAYEASMSSEQQDGRRKAFALILDTNAVDVNSVRDGLTPIQTCVAPELLSLFLERGANPNVVKNGAAYRNVDLVDQAVVDATMYEEGSWTARRLRGIERAKLFADNGMDSIVGHSIEKRVQFSCNLVINGKRWNEKSCRELSKFIKASKGTFGNN